MVLSFSTIEGQEHAKLRRGIAEADSNGCGFGFQTGCLWINEALESWMKARLCY
ncbi:hypothetical protein QLX67_03425 [Balneolaceae bacterium ANBcel3]|nr:hypothetical protein [Balneolaceae bacterium ANBcel3]